MTARENAEPRPLRLLLADDHAIVREGLRTLLEEEADVAVVGEARDGLEAVELAARLRPDVILMDLAMPGIDGVEAARRVRDADPDCQVLMLTSFADERNVREAMRAGAVGYLLKDVLKPDLLRAVRGAAQGIPSLHPEAQRHLIRSVTSPAEAPAHDSLTGRELDVLKSIARGRSNKEIAADLGLTEGTVKGYVSAVLSKLDVADRTQAALYAAKNGLAEG